MFLKGLINIIKEEISSPINIKYKGDMISIEQNLSLDNMGEFRLHLILGNDDITLVYISIENKIQGKGTGTSIIKYIIEECISNGLLLIINQACNTVLHIATKIISGYKQDFCEVKYEIAEFDKTAINLSINFRRGRVVNVLDEIISAFNKKDRYCIITEEQYLMLIIDNLMTDTYEKLNVLLTKIKGHPVPIAVELQGKISYMHFTKVSNLEIIIKEGLCDMYKGESNIDGIYAFNLKNQDPVHSVNIVAADILEGQDILVCTGNFDGKYYQIVNRTGENYIILQANNVKVDKFLVINMSTNIK